MKSFTNSVLMVRPANFGFNPETAINNAFQTLDEDESENSITSRAIEEFDAMVKVMLEAGVHVFVWQDSETPVKPDAVFPNNWFSTTPEGWMLTYPLFAPNRRRERDPAILDFVDQHFLVDRRYTFEHYEEKGLFLEGTGSMLFDHDQRVVYACLSPRTDIGLLDKLAVLTGYEMMAFHGTDKSGLPIYHTNVMMALGTRDAVVCLESIADSEERTRLIERLEQSGKKICDISFKQMNAFAGNMIQLLNDQGEPLMIMSRQAHDSLTKKQLQQLGKTSRIIAADISTIETYGGGSARCMIAEIFLSKRDDVDLEQ